MVKEKRWMKAKIEKVFDKESKGYHRQYNPEIYRKYPANHFRLKVVMDILYRIQAKTVFDIGCGTCEPMVSMLRKNIHVRGMDLSKK